MGAITLVSQPPLTPRGIYNDLGTFGFSFLVLITIWLRYTRIMSVMPVESRRTTRLNTALLFCVSVEPFLFGLLARPPAITPPSALQDFEGTASTLFGLDLGVMMAVLGVFSLTLASEEKGLVGQEFIRQFRKESYSWFVGSAAFLVSVLPLFYAVQVGPLGPLRFYLWLVPIFTVWLRRAAGGS